jgi:hypothetical protein
MDFISTLIFIFRLIKIPKFLIVFIIFRLILQIFFKFIKIYWISCRKESIEWLLLAILQVEKKDLRNIM